MAHVTEARHRPPRRRPEHGLLTLPAFALLGATVLAVGYVAYVLWPRWPGEPVSLDAPSIPVTVAGEIFNLEPAAIRRAVQRRPGTETRIDLSYLWPSLTPPDPAIKPTVGAPLDPNTRLFMTIAQTDGALPPSERMKTIYPRYLTDAPPQTTDGLAIRLFRDGTPYQGEDLVFEAAAPDRFNARCTRNGIGNTGMCLYDRRIGEANVTVRFPRDWLVNWRDIAQGIERLLARLHPAKT